MKLPRSFDAIPVEGRRVLVRADLNVPLSGGVIGDDTRVRAAVPTIQALRARGARVVVCSHLGRPKGVARPELSLRPVCTRLSELLAAPVAFATDCVGLVAEQAVSELADSDVLLLENLRFHAGEEQNDPHFAAALAALADVYVDDAFGAAHRAHASVAGVAGLLPAAAGYLLRRELEVLGQLLEAPAHPFVVVAGGVKVADKIGVIERLAVPADAILIGGAMAYTFVVAQGGSVGSSLHEDEQGQESARRALAACREAGCELLLPVDSVCGRSFAPDPPQQVSRRTRSTMAGWASTSGRRRPGRMPLGCATRRRASGTARWERSRWRPTRPVRRPSPRLSPPAAARRSSAEATPSRP